MGGEGVGYHSTEHYTDKNGDGYRIDRPTATMCMTDVSRNDLWYDTGTALDGQMYPDATTHDFYIGSIHPGDWFNYTVNVKTAGTYSMSGTTRSTCKNMRIARAIPPSSKPRASAWHRELKWSGARRFRIICIRSSSRRRVLSPRSRMSRR